ncbi:MAG TPA: HAD family hydrolase [Chthoniobacterales bacterium]|jgi:putative hydrolase of the HAD superfamily
MIRTIFFDMGGTLDGEGHWLERFLALYKSFGLELRRATIREAFDAAEQNSAGDEEMPTSSLEEMVKKHVRWQLQHLGLTNPELEAHLVNGFLDPTIETIAENARLLESLAERGFTLGVISNGCGNVARLCEDFGYAPFLSLIVDSRRVGLSKPDPAIYCYAAGKIGGDPETMLMVGDSLERDIVPAKKIGMKTAWFGEGDCPDRSAVDLRLQRLAELPALLR